MRNDRRTLCLIHGWGFDSRVWGGLVAELPAHWQITTLDLPGYGANSTPNPPAEIDTIARSMTPLVPAGSVLIGWSLGGMVAIKIARQMGDDIAALILLASTPCFVKKSDWPHGIEQEQLQSLAGRLPNDANSVLREFAALTANGDDSPRQTIRELRASITDGPTKTNALMTGLGVLRDADLRSDLADLKCRVVMLLGERDKLITKNTGRAVKTFCPQMQLDYIHATGHAPFISQSKQTACLLAQYVREQEINEPA